MASGVARAGEKRAVRGGSQPPAIHHSPFTIHRLLMLLARLAFRGTMGGRRTGRLAGGRRAGVRGHLRGVPARTAIQKFVKDAAMITCERCQTENIEGSQYCDECGAALEPATAGGPAGRAQTS